MLIKKHLIIFWFSLFIFISLPSSDTYAQLPTIQDLIFYSNDLISNNTSNNSVVACIRLDGRCLFRLAFPKTELTERINEIQYRLNEIKELYLQSKEENIAVNIEANNNIYDIYVSIEDDKIRLLSVTQPDASVRGLSLENTAEQIRRQLERGLLKSKREREKDFLVRQGIISLSILILMTFSSYFVRNWGRKSRKIKEELNNQKYPLTNSLLIRLNQEQFWYFKEIKYRIAQLLDLLIWGGGVLYILGLFPQTRTVQLVIVTAVRIPVRVVSITLIAYFCIRLTYALINHICSELVSSKFLTPKANRRLQLRINTISTVSKSIVTILGISISLIISLATVGVDIAPLIAGAGIIGLAISFASQNLIKDAINGFLIIIEDQYAVGDVISVGSVAGLVENINLRITQIRDAEGRLITIPNSEVRIVANLSSQWSRADLSIPISYHTDVNSALELIEKVAYVMAQDDRWQEYILETPQVLGVENFSDRGTIVRVWIKTEPLKQWEVSREFRRRIKTAFDNAGMPIQPPEQQVWLNRHQSHN